MSVPLAHLPPDLWSEIFGHDHPVFVEIGPGKGDFLVTAARQHPEHSFFAIERSRAGARRIEERIAAHALRNARVVNGDATCVLDMLPDACVAGYSVQFPDPWWKRRHHRRRVWTPPFVALLRRTLVPGGTIELITDVADYFAVVQELLDGTPDLERVTAGPYDGATTSFARKARARGAAIYRSVHRRRGG